MRAMSSGQFRTEPSGQAEAVEEDHQFLRPGARDEEFPYGRPPSDGYGGAEDNWEDNQKGNGRGRSLKSWSRGESSRSKSRSRADGGGGGRIWGRAEKSRSRGHSSFDEEKEKSRNRIKISHDEDDHTPAAVPAPADFAGEQFPPNAGTGPFGTTPGSSWDMHLMPVITIGDETNEEIIVEKDTVPMSICAPTPVVAESAAPPVGQTFDSFERKIAVFAVARGVAAAAVDEDGTFRTDARTSSGESGDSKSSGESGIWGRRFLDKGSKKRTKSRSKSSSSSTGKKSRSDADDSHDEEGSGRSLRTKAMRWAKGDPEKRKEAEARAKARNDAKAHAKADLKKQAEAVRTAQFVQELSRKYDIANNVVKVELSNLLDATTVPDSHTKGMSAHISFDPNKIRGPTRLPLKLQQVQRSVPPPPPIQVDFVEEDNGAVAIGHSMTMVLAPSIEQDMTMIVPEDDDDGLAIHPSSTMIVLEAEEDDIVMRTVSDESADDAGFDEHRGIICGLHGMGGKGKDETIFTRKQNQKNDLEQHGQNSKTATEDDDIMRVVSSESTDTRDFEGQGGISCGEYRFVMKGKSETSTGIQNLKSEMEQVAQKTGKDSSTHAAEKKNDDTPILVGWKPLFDGECLVHNAISSWKICLYKKSCPFKN